MYLVTTEPLISRERILRVFEKGSGENFVRRSLYFVFFAGYVASLLAYLLTYLLTYLLHGDQFFVRS